MPSCQHCAKPVSASSAICPHCGRKTRPVESRRTHAPVACPGCDGACDVVLLGSSHLDLCRRCRGLWFDKGELREFGDALSVEDLHLEVAEVLRELGRQEAPSRVRSYLKCPVCEQVMMRSNYARVSGIMIHTCSEHGCWADHDASLGLVELLGAGGEARLRDIVERQEKEFLENSLRRIHARQTALEAKASALDARTRTHLLLDWLGFL